MYRIFHGMIERGPPLHRSVSFLETIIISLGAVGKVWGINNKLFKQKVGKFGIFSHFSFFIYLFKMSTSTRQWPVFKQTYFTRCSAIKSVSIRTLFKSSHWQIWALMKKIFSNSLYRYSKQNAYFSWVNKRRLKKRNIYINEKHHKNWPRFIKIKYV